jgi:hypothetical protein
MKMIRNIIQKIRDRFLSKKDIEKLKKYIEVININMERADYIIEQQKKIINYERKKARRFEILFTATLKTINRIHVADDVIQSINPSDERFERFRDEKNRQTVFYYLGEQ